MDYYRILVAVCSPFKIASFLDRDDVYLTPNMTYKPRILKKKKAMWLMDL